MVIGEHVELYSIIIRHNTCIQGSNGVYQMGYMRHLTGYFRGYRHWGLGTCEHLYTRFFSILCMQVCALLFPLRRPVYKALTVHFRSNPKITNTKFKPHICVYSLQIFSLLSDFVFVLFNGTVCIL